MSIFDDIFGIISAPFRTIFDIGKTLIGGANDVLQATGISSLLAVITSLTQGIDSLVSQTAGIISSIVDPITKVVDSVNMLTKDIQDKIISPIITPITTTITEIKSLTGTIDKLVDQGISGILKIPGAIADALSGVSGAFDRSSRILAEANVKNVNENLVPGFSAFMVPGLQSVAEGMLKFSPPKDYTADTLFQVQPGGLAGIHTAEEVLAKIVAKYKDPKHWWEALPLVLLDIFGAVPLLISSIEAQSEEFSDSGRYINPTAGVGISDALTLYRLGVFNEATARTEMQRKGLDTERQTAMLETTYFIPNIDRAADWYRRGLINKGQYEKVLSTWGVRGDQFAALEAEQAALISPAILVDWLARGIMDQKQFDDQMFAQGHDKASVLQYIKGAITPQRLNTTIYAKANELAAQFGWFASTYGASPPDDVKAAGHQNREDEAEIFGQWAAHWSVMPIGTAVTLFFRGEMTRDEVKIIVAQNNFPPDMVDLFIKAQSPVIPPRSIAGLLQSGTIDEVKAREILKERGFNNEDTDLLVDNALASIGAKTKAPTTDATKLTVAQLKSAYIDGVIDRDTYSGLLATHGLVGDDLVITLALTDYDLLKATKKDISDTIVAEVKLGALTVDQGTQALFDAGFSGTEVAKLSVTLQQTKRASAKLPSLADMGKMAKKSLITPADLLAGIQALGYADPWDALLASLILGGDTVDGTTTQPSAAA